MAGRLLRSSPLAVAALLLLAPGDAAASACPDAALQPAPETLPRVEAAMVCLLNEHRVGAGLAPLKVDRRLERSAGFHVRDMIAHRFFDHQLAGHPTLLRRILDTGYFAGVRDGLYTENLGYGPEPAGTAEALVGAWMASDYHRRNILNRHFRDIGLGSGLTGPGPPFHRYRSSAVYATDFGRRLGSTRKRRRACRKRAARRTTGALPRRRYCRRSARRR